MKRIGVATAVALLVLGLVPAFGMGTASAAPAQATGLPCVAGSGGDYPPAPGAIALENLTLSAGHFTPGGSGSLTIIGAGGGVYSGVGYSTPFVLPDLTAQGGRLEYRNLAVPAGFELNSMHHIDLCKGPVKVGNLDFCVDRKGDVAAISVCKSAATAAKAGKLARTGSDLMDLLRVALLVVGTGAGALYLRRRQRAAKPA